MGTFGVKWVGYKIWINFDSIFVQSFPLARTARTSLLHIDLLVTIDDSCKAIQKQRKKQLTSKSYLKGRPSIRSSLSRY